MKKTAADHFSDISLRLLRPIGFLWMRYDMQKKITTTVDFRRKDPFLLVANHTYQFDVVQIALPFRVTPAIISQESLLSTMGLRWLLQHVGRVIPKSKGASDVRTIRHLLTYVKKGYPVMVMPEGDSTYFGHTGEVEPATAKLIKKLELDVVVAKVKGGYLSKPRWAKHARRNRYAEIHYDTLFSKGDVRRLSVEQIEHILVAALAHDDYEWQRHAKHVYQGERMAEGFENVIYRCPECGAYHAFAVQDDAIVCTACDTHGVMNAYGFIEGFSCETLRQFDEAQRIHDDELRQQTFQSEASLQFIDHDKRERTKAVRVQVAYQHHALHIKHKSVETVPVAQMVHPVLTMRRNLTFEYQNKVYLIKLDSYAMSFLRAVQTKY